MIDLEIVFEIQRILIKEFGGKSGVRDVDLLLSALNRPMAGSGEIEFYSSVPHKAAALIESIVKNHPFVDGNKRIGYVLMRLILLENGMDIIATQVEKYNFVISIASGEFSYEQIYFWILNHLNK
jgi:death-on-curing protein